MRVLIRIFDSLYLHKCYSTPPHFVEYLLSPIFVPPVLVPSIRKDIRYFVRHNASVSSLTLRDRT